MAIFMKTLRIKRFLILSVAVMAGISLSASVSAANAFSDVPAGHRAYGSISKLIAAGVIIGSGETSFNIAKAEGRLGGLKVTAGRDDDMFAGGYIWW